jgi:hypothetical protein
MILARFATENAVAQTRLSFNLLFSYESPPPKHTLTQDPCKIKIITFCRRAASGCQNCHSAIHKVRTSNVAMENTKALFVTSSNHD